MAAQEGSYFGGVRRTTSSAQLMFCRMANDQVQTTNNGYKSRARPNVPLHPKHPERVCWGCDKLCPTDDLRCGNGTIRAPHPSELFGDDWDRYVPAAASF